MSLRPGSAHGPRHDCKVRAHSTCSKLPMRGKQQLIRHRLLLRGKQAATLGFIAGTTRQLLRASQNSPVIEPIVLLSRRAGGDADAAVNCDAGRRGPGRGAARHGTRCDAEHHVVVLSAQQTEESDNHSSSEPSEAECQKSSQFN